MAEFIVGTVLAVIPLVLKGFSEYADFAVKFETFMRYSSELQKLDMVMRAQSWIVQNRAFQLLESLCGDSEKVRAFLSGEVPISLDGLDISDARLSRLNEMSNGFELWRSALLQVTSATNSINQRLNSLRPRIGNDAELGDGIRQFKKKLKLSFTKPELKTMIQDLRDSVADFKDLSDQIRARLESAPRRNSRDQSAQGTPKADPKSLETYRRVRNVSSKLYDIIVMRCSCATPHRHVVSIGLLDKAALAKNPQKAVFSIVIGSSGHHSDPDIPIILEVEFINGKGQVKAHTPVVSTLASTPRRSSAVMAVLLGPDGATPGTIRPLVPQLGSTFGARYAFTGRKDSRDIESASLSTPDNTQIPRTIEVTKDMCRQLREMIQSDATSTMYIKGPDDQAFEMRSLKQGPTRTHRSLADIISSIPETGRIPRASVANLAGALAHAVLQYHSTPWLPGTWKSHDVAFFDDVSERSLSSPYLTTEFFGTSQQGQVPPTPCLQSRESLSAGTARNEMLFHLGVVLLELGFSQPWPDLRQRALAKLPPEQQSNNRVAEKLAQENELRDRMGLNYCRIVRKCLACDFGLGEDNFSDAELQGAFLVDVVMALEKAERVLRELDM